MRLLVANTDADWYRHLSGLASGPSGLNEANFWKPSGGTGFGALGFGEPLVFKLKKAHGHAVVGFGLFAAFRRLSVAEAWEAFGQANGAATLDEMWTRIARYAYRAGPPEPYRPRHVVGCILLAAPVLFPREMRVDGPADWADSIVTGRGYDSAAGEGRRIWRECLDRAATLAQAVDIAAPAVVQDPGGQASLFRADSAERYGTSQTIRPRLGQGTFRYALEAAYGRCAVSGEHALPALDAAHIVPYGEDAAGHALENGLLLRADIHRLFDAGYVTVTPDYEFRVSGRLHEDYDNGRVYYAMAGRTIWTPEAPYPKPDRDRLGRHASTVFLGS